MRCCFAANFFFIFYHIFYIQLKGEKIGCYYIGRLDNSEGKIFDQLQKKARGSQPLSFKVGTGRVIRGWDEALLKMTVGETAAVTPQGL